MRESIETLRVEDAGYAPRSPESNLEHPTECADGICNARKLEGGSRGERYGFEHDIQASGDQEKGKREG